MRDYRADYPGVEPEIGWVVSNFKPVRSTPMKVQGFSYAALASTLGGRWVEANRLASWNGDEGIWVPECEFQTTRKWFYAEPGPAVALAQEAIDREQADLYRRREACRQALAFSTPALQRPKPLVCNATCYLCQGTIPQGEACVCLPEQDDDSDPWGHIACTKAAGYKIEGEVD